MVAGGGVIVHQKDGVVVAGGEAAFRGDVSNLSQVGSLARDDVVAEVMGNGLGAAKLDVSADRVT